MKFTPKTQENEASNSTIKAAPYYDSEEAKKIPFYYSQRTIKEVKTLIEKQMVILDSRVVSFLEGTFEDDAGRERHGHIINFTHQGVPGRLSIAALPIKKKTRSRKKNAIVMSLMNTYEWLRTAYTTPIFTPGSSPLMPYLLIHAGTENEMTIVEMLEKQGLLHQSSQPLLVERE